MGAAVRTPSLRGDKSVGRKAGSSRPAAGRGSSRARGASPGMRDQTQCRFCRRVEKHVDYKDVETLSKLLTHRGKIYSRKRSGNCASCQRKVKRAIKRARFIALLPFTT